MRNRIFARLYKKLKKQSIELVLSIQANIHKNGLFIHKLIVRARCFPAILGLGVVVIIVIAQIGLKNVNAYPYRTGSNISSGTRSTSIVAVDFNNDGMVDVADIESGLVGIRFGNGDATFSVPTFYSAGTQPRSIGIGDFNVDGFMDIVAANEAANTSVLINDGSGGLLAAVNYATGNGSSSFPKEVAVADFNNDGKLDFAVTASVTPRNIHIYLGNGDGTFIPGTNLNPGSNPYNITARDLNNDGNQDIVYTMDSFVCVNLGNGNSTFQPRSCYATKVTQFGSLLTADFNGDGNMDIARANYLDVSIWINNGNGTYGARTDIPISAYQEIIRPLLAEDVNDDGKLDLLSPDDNKFAVLFGNGDGTFNAVVDSPVLTSISVSAFIADIDGDLDKDILFDNYPPSTGYYLSILLSILNDPTTSLITPSTKMMGDLGFTITVDGTKFTPSSVVQINGSDRVTTYISPTQVTAVILDADLALGGNYDITVFNATTGISNAQVLAVDNPAPTTSSITPTRKSARSAAFDMTVAGTNFLPTSVVRIDGIDRATAYINSTELTATILDSDMVAAGTPLITVFNPTPGGGISNAQTFTVTAPGGRPVFTPNNLAQGVPYALDATSIRWVFDNINSQPVSVRLYQSDVSNLLLDTGSLTFNEGTGLFVDETGLLPNTKYEFRYVVAYSGSAESGSDGQYVPVYTLANNPQPPAYADQTDTSVTVTFAADGNPANTLMSIKDMVSGQYVQADGTLGSAQTYLPFDSGWNNGSVKVSDLTKGTFYQFALSAQNGTGVIAPPDSAIAGISTPYDLSVGSKISLASGPVILKKGVQVISGNTSVKGVSIAGVAGERPDLMSANGIFSAIKGAHQVINVILALFGALFVMSLVTMFRSMAGMKLSLIPKFLRRESSEFFGEYSPKKTNGTHQYSYTHHKRLQRLSRTSLFSGFGILTLKVALVLAVALFGSNLKNSIASQYCFDACEKTYPNVYPGDSLSYYIEYANNTDQSISPATITDTLDLNTAYSSLSAVLNGTTDTAALAGQGISPRISGNTLSFDLGTIAPYATGFVTFNSKINAKARGTVSNQATLNGQLQVAAAGGPVTAVSNTIILNVTPPVEAIAPPVIPPVAPPVTTPIAPKTPATPILSPTTGSTETQSGAGVSGSTGASGAGGSVEPSAPFIPSAPNIPLVTVPAPLPIIENAEPMIQVVTLDDVIDQIMPVLSSPQIEKTTERVVLPTMLGLSAAATVPAFVAGAFNVLPYLHLLFLEPLMAIFGKRHKKHGVVYNALTKLPLDLAVIRMYDASSKNLVATKITDGKGRFYMLAKKGEYFLAVNKPGFIFPSVYLKDDVQDAKYMDVYHSQKVQVFEDGTPITVSIPLDPQEKAARQEASEVRRFMFAKIQSFIPRLGIILNVVGLIIYPTLLMLGFLAIHLGLFFVFRRFVQSKRPKSWGVVYDENSRQPLHNAVVRIFDTRFNKLLETYVTDGSGRYSFLVGPNQYQVVGEKHGYVDYKTTDIDLTKASEEDAVVAEDLGMNKQDELNVIQLGKSMDIPLKREG